MKQLIILIFTIIGLPAIAQNTQTVPSISFKGKITFERKINTHKQLDEMMKMRGGADNSFAENIKKQVPKYKTDIFELSYTDKKTIYKPAKDGISESKMMMGNIPADKNIVYTDLTNGQSITEKNLFDKSFLVKDSTKQFSWKITEEFRKIAGYNCRRAETIIMDSVYVIAFYTDAIVANTGPEGFNGLPGMILGIVMPRLNVTYFATKVDNFIAGEKEITPPSKGEIKTNAALEAGVRKNMSNWGNFVERMLWYINL